MTTPAAAPKKPSTRKSSVGGETTAANDTSTAQPVAPNLASDRWPLYEVFVRANRGLAHTHVGSLRASDSEIALRNARDVYTRRQEGLSLWVIPSSAILAASPDETDTSFNPTADQIYRHPSFGTAPTTRDAVTDGTGSGKGQLYEVFVRARRGVSHTHVGSLPAPDAATALRNARDVYTRHEEGVSVWVIPSTAITAPSPEDKDSFFSPATDKIYRFPTFYDVPEGVQM